MAAPQHYTFAAAPFADTVAHAGRGAISAARMLSRESGFGYAFVDLVVVPPGASIGLHRHGEDEEMYVVIDGHAVMSVDGEEFPVSPGDVVVNRPGGSHALDNRGPLSVRLVVVDVRTAQA